jgi:hypothetical protein
MDEKGKIKKEINFLDIQNSQNYVNDALATFLTSSLNVELVHVILESITKHSKGQLRSNDFHEFLKE